MNFFPFHIGDYAVHTRHLSLLEDLAYRRLLDLYYTREGSLPPDTQVIARLLGMKEQHAEVESVLCEFFLQNEDGWTHARCDAELTKMHAKQENARASVAKRTSVTQAPRERDAGVIEASTTNTNTNTNTNTKKEKTPSVSRARRCPPGFEIDAKSVETILRERPGLDIERETALFLDCEFQKPRSDWPAAWRTWMRKAQVTRAQPKSFKAQDEAAAAEKYRRWTGQDNPDVIDMEQTHGPLIANG